MKSSKTFWRWMLEMTLKHFIILDLHSVWSNSSALFSALSSLITNRRCQSSWQWVDSWVCQRFSSSLDIRPGVCQRMRSAPKLWSTHRPLEKAYVCVCVCAKERETHWERDSVQLDTHWNNFSKQILKYFIFSLMMGGKKITVAHFSI